MTAKFFVVLDQASAELSVQPSSVLSQNQAAYQFGEKPKFMVMAQADDRAQAYRFLELMQNRSAA